MSRSKRKSKPNSRSRQRVKNNITNRNNRLLKSTVKRTEPEEIFRRDVLKKTERRIKCNDLNRLGRLKKPKFYVKRNFLGFPTEIKRANLTPLQRKKSEIMYKFEPSWKRLIVCARRAMRREVLFAKRGIGSGIKRRRKTFNDDSKVRC